MIMGIINFKNKGTEDINYGRTSKEALTEKVNAAFE
jgi:hypothetical protein